jgi:hypothetical protein
MNRSSLRSIVTDRVDQEREKDVNQRISTVLSSSVYKPIISRNHSRSIVTARVDLGREKDLNQHTSTIFRSSVYKTVTSRNNSRSIVTDRVDLGREKDVNQHKSTVLNSSVYKPVISRNNSRSTVTDRVDLGREKDVNQRTSTVLNSSVFKPVTDRNRSKNTTHGYSLQSRNGEVAQCSSVHSNNFYHSVISRHDSRETGANSTKELGSKDVTQHPLKVWVDDEYQPFINTNAYGDTDIGSEAQNGSNGIIRYPSAVVTNEFSPILNCRTSAGQNVRGHVTRRPLVVESGSVYQPVINKNIVRYADSVCAGRNGLAKVTERPLKVPNGDVNQPLIEEVSRQVVSYRPTSAGSCPVYQQEPSQERIFWFLYLSTLMWVLLFALCVYK